MRAVRLHGIRDLRVETVPVPEPGPHELLVRVEGCGVCPTDIRKWLIGVNDGDYPFNPGHEWVGRVQAAGAGAQDWVGRRVYGDTYAGYAELALVSVEPGDWSNGALELPDDLALERAVLVEPLADCLHAVRDQAAVAPGDRIAVVGAGQMGLQLIAAAATGGARVLAVEPLAQRRELARQFGAEEVTTPAGWAEAAQAGGQGLKAILLSIGAVELVAQATKIVASGGRVVLFAGFGNTPNATLDLNDIHYREVSLVGSEWIGAPPNQRRERYAEALDLLRSGRAPFERLVEARCGLDELADAFEAQRALERLKTVVVP
jgi:2-desacetyl-2-hydroxyethyl bacteriochlorophyllide A dehydrogenase